MSETNEELREIAKKVVSIVIAQDEKETVTVGDLLKAHILFERERCAKIASEEPRRCQNATDDYSKGYLDGSLATAGAIRRRIEKEGS